MSSSPRNARPVVPSRPESDPRVPVSKRRGFLLALGAGGIGAAAIAARSLKGNAPAAPADPDAASGDGYRVTDHVRRYYRTAKI
jgi:hypothetical protein